ncbi:WXG100 family type VII secretion target [Vallitalea sp.]|jgi:WXG100 family type VII secretion target|uniref:WXG100 family type VII secretion target n=1 Tax=Vallitalea sp. TaxID=1882829 RepID=UPI0025D882E9|nr:WXG100 family type VII secretion target [Vallitalea sp.]MCT4686967.1 WXG100 family type VII secretion target [Vallitalea sp.]
MAKFTVTTQMLEDTSSNIANINTQFNEIMDDITGLMNNLQANWKSDAAEQFISRFRGLKNDFDNYSQVIVSYSTFLTNAANDYSSAETAIDKATADLFS